MEAELTRPERSSWLRRNWSALLSAVSVVIIPALENSQGSIPDYVRLPALYACLAIIFIGVLLTAHRERRAAELEQENFALRQNIEKTEPEDLLQQVAAALFKAGAWRLTVYRKDRSSDPGLGDHLIKLVSVASFGDQRGLGDSAISIKPGTQFQLLFLANLADPRFRRAEESGPSPEDPSEWLSWRNEIFGERKTDVADDSTFLARKFAWYAVQDPRTRTVYAAIAESADPEGIVIDRLQHELSPSWLIFASQLAELRQSTSSAGSPP